MDSIREVIKRHWGYDRFLPLQAEAMRCVLDRRDSVVVLPTGGGKSLCFQAPALVLPGVAVVISPLISLMKDQVDALRTSGVSAACINSAMANSEREAACDAIRSGAIKLLYVSPERIVQPRFMDFLRDSGLSYLVVDEAHCISHWGHDFRPEYRELRCLRKALPETPIHTYTATATPHVRDDIVQEMSLRDPEVLVGSFDRSNLMYRVQRRDDAYRQVRAMIDAHPGESGLIYCIRRADVDALCAKLSAAGVRALPYHAGMSDADRRSNQEAFSKDNVDIIVATVAFGMGIDKSNVRFVVHAGMPKSIEHYQQESGRAGRDGLEAECRLLYSGADFMVWKSMIEKMEPAEARDIALQKLRDMFGYCTGMTCRHNALVAYFGETYRAGPCGACDVCLDEFDAIEDSLGVAQTILDCVAQLGRVAGPAYTTLVLSGSDDPRILSRGHNRLKTYGRLVSTPDKAIRKWIDELVGEGFLEKVGEYNVLVPTSKGRHMGAGPDQPRLSKPIEPRAKKRAAAQPSTPDLSEPASRAPVRTVDYLERALQSSAGDRALFERLRKVRREKAEELGVPPYVVFSDAALRDLVHVRPRTRAAFLSVKGVGSAKCQAFADVFLQAIRDHETVGGAGSEDHVPDLIEAAVVPRPRVSRDAIQAQADALFARGCSIEEAAETLLRQSSTVAGYLEHYITTHGVTDPTPWVHESVVERVREAAARTDGTKLKPVYDLLNGEVDYGEIRICMACFRNAQQRNDPH